MTLLMLAMLVLAMSAALAVRHHQQVLAWQRELELAFDAGAVRELPRHRRL